MGIIGRVIPQIDAILQSLDTSGDVVLDRILWESTDGSEVISINIKDKKALPTFRSGQEILDGIEAGYLKVIQNDPYAYLSKPEETINEIMRNRRDKAWDVIQYLVEDHRIDILYRNYRGALIANCSEQKHTTEDTIMHYLRKWWQRGQKPNALLPDYYSCGGRGKGKTIGDKKLGRRRKYVNNPTDQQGVNIDEEKRILLLRGLKKYYGRGEGQYRSFTRAFNRTLEDYFNIGYKLQNSEFIPVMPPAETLLSKNQARYWYNKSIGIKRRTIARVGETAYNLRFRPLLGNTNKAVRMGPGSEFQIDSTVGDIYLVSFFDRARIVGRPTIYLVKDVFSRLIIGMHVTLESPSWTGAMVALENAMTDKIEYCHRYGIEIHEEDWPAHHIPVLVLADRGELKGYNADSIPKSLGIKVSNAAPYRAEWKAVIERAFREMNEDQLHRLPGAVRKAHERGDPDYRLAAIFDINQLRALMILWILKLNNNSVLKKYRRNQAMMADQVDAIPIDLWNWGIKNVQGIMREKPSDIVRINLMPLEEASITERGIEFRSLHYDCDQARQEGWFTRVQRRRKITISYDPRSVNQIFYLQNNGEKYETCKLLDMDSMFLNRDWDEVKDQRVVDRMAVESMRTRELQSDAEYQTAVSAILKEAEEQTRSAARDQSKSARVKNMRANRHEDRQRERSTQAWTIGEKVGTIPTEPQTSEIHSEPTEDEYIGPPSYAALIRQQMAERDNDDSD